jgi:hypothetical protein
VKSPFSNSDAVLITEQHSFLLFNEEYVVDYSYYKDVEKDLSFTTAEQDQITIDAIQELYKQRHNL